MRYRSVEIFGDEKRLEGLCRTSLFGPGRLTWDLLACARRAPPLPAVSVGTGPDVLVVENSDPCWAAVDVLSHAGDHAIGAVVRGSGNAFPAQVSSPDRGCGRSRPRGGKRLVLGDFDPSGLEIAARAAAAAAELDMPAIRPAHRLWEAMAARPTQDPGRCDWETTGGRGWLGEPLWGQFHRIRAERGRVAQEAVAPEVIAAWATAAT